MERVQQEIEKTMAQVDRPGDAFRLWRDSGAFAVLAPELATLSDVALATLDLLPRAASADPEQQHRTVTRLTALLLDVEPCGGARSSALAALLQRARALDRGADRAMGAAQRAAPRVARRRLVRRAMRRCAVGYPRSAARASNAFFAVLAARLEAESGAGLVRVSREAVQALRARAEAIAPRDPIEISDLAIAGGDLMKAGIKAGPQLGATLRALLEWVLEDPARNSHDRLLAHARESAGGRSQD